MKDNNNNFNIDFNDEDMTVNSLLDAISEIEYPKYLLDAVAAIQEWLRGLAVNIEEASVLDDDNNKSSGAAEPDNKLDDKLEKLDDDELELDDDELMEFFNRIFDSDEPEQSELEDSLEDLFEKIDAIDENVDVIPNTRKPAGNKDAMIINLLSPESDGGLRTAIDYAAVFNRSKCKRVWILSDSFVFDDAAHFAGHINALEQQGINIRFILINPWGWVELPLSRASALRKQIVWRGNSCGKNDLNLTGD